MDSLCQECAPQEIYKALIIGRLRVRMHAVCKTLILRFDPDSRLQLSSPNQYLPTSRSPVVITPDDARDKCVNVAYGRNGNWLPDPTKRIVACSVLKTNGDWSGAKSALLVAGGHRMLLKSLANQALLPVSLRPVFVGGSAPARADAITTEVTSAAGSRNRGGACAVDCLR